MKIPTHIHTVKGSVTLVGFGPGNPELLTIGGLKAIQEADIVYYDNLVDEEFILSVARKAYYVGKRKGNHSKEQEEINTLLLEAAQKGEKVVRLKGGDPMIFAHGGEEIAFLESNGIPVKVIPGITTASALAAYSRIALTHRGISSSVALVSGHSKKKIPTPQADTLVYYMGASQLKEIASVLLDRGRKKETPVLLVHNVSLDNQQEYFTTLGQLEKDMNEYPTPLIALIGEVVYQRKEATQLLKHTYTFTYEYPTA